MTAADHTDQPDLDALFALAEAASETAGPWEFGRLIVNGETKAHGLIHGEKNLAFIAACSPDTIKALVQRVKDAEAEHRDLTRRLGFGDNITEPQADNDTIVEWLAEQGRDANEWRESQMWRNECAVAGCDPAEDCAEHDPWLRLQAENADLAAKVTRVKGISGRLDGLVAGVTALAEKWEQPQWGAQTRNCGASLRVLIRDHDGRTG